MLFTNHDLHAIGDDTVLYSVRIPDALGGGINQNQLTTLPGNGVRVRTAQPSRRDR